MFKNPFYKDVAIAVIGIMAVMLSCRFTLGVMAVVIVLAGLFAIVARKSAAAIFCFAMPSFLAVFNRVITGIDTLIFIVVHFSFPLMAFSLLLSSGRKIHVEKLPIGWLFLYLAVACASSADGWMPIISYLKILNFSLMLISLYLLSKYIQSDLSCLQFVRVIFMAAAIIMIVGSAVTYFIPSIGYSMMVERAGAYGVLVDADDLVEHGTQLLFNGMSCHSQWLSATVACLATWVLCDMILVERRLSILHCGILFCVPILLFMSRSRGGLLMLVCVTVITLFVTIPRAHLSSKVKHNLMSVFWVFSTLLVCAGVFFQIRNGAISRWIRKTDDVAGDSRSLNEAFTGSRQDSILMNMRDFHLNPLLGKGFQVVDGMKQAYAANRISWFSASVEKGVTPYVILGETGILGVIAFAMFLVSFYFTCIRQRYMSLMTNFTCFLVANLADSTLFSPSALGGFMWMISCVGAFSTDCLAKRLHRMHQQGGWGMVEGGWANAMV